MDTVLSSRATYWYKVVIPIITFAMMVGGTVFVFVNPDSRYVHAPNGDVRGQVGYIMVAATVAMVAVMWMMLAPLKRVALAGDELLISNFRTDIRVALSQVASIEGPSTTNPKRYTIRFEDDTEFGRTVTSIPPMVWSLNPWTEADEVETLRSAWRAVRPKA